MTQPPKRILFVASEDWFFAGHFLHVARAALAAGYAASVAVRIFDPAHRATIEAAGIRVVETQTTRNARGLFHVAGQVAELARIMRRERPAIVHLISVRMIALGALAAIIAGCRVRVQAVTGLGAPGASPTPRNRALLWLIGAMLRGPLNGKRVAFVFENPDDAATLGFPPGDPRITIVGGAGIDPGAWPVAPLPPLPPLKIAIVARMVASKGIGEAVAAIGIARGQGADVRLSLYGAPDAQNPRNIPEDRLRAWSARDGIAWHGRTRDIAAVWRDHHVVCVPSLGGEGLPRSLLEGAACGRAIVTTATPGCRYFARDGIEGIVVAPGDAQALAAAFVAMARDPAAVKRFGAAARARIDDGFTAQHVSAAFLAVYARLCPPGERNEAQESASPRGART